MSFQSDLANLGNFADITFDDAATTAKGANAKTIFCNGWPATKAVLEAIAAMIRNPIVKVVIGIVIKAGEALSAKIC